MGGTFGEGWPGGSPPQSRDGAGVEAGGGESVLACLGGQGQDVLVGGADCYLTTTSAPAPGFGDEAGFETKGGRGGAKGENPYGCVHESTIATAVRGAYRGVCVRYHVQGLYGFQEVVGAGRYGNMPPLTVRFRPLLRLETPVTLAAMLVLRHFELVADRPWWVYLGLTLFASLLTASASWLCPPEYSRRNLVITVAAQTVAVTPLMYVTGWGPMLAIGYGVVLANSVEVAGARVVTPLLWSTGICMALGQTAIALGVVDSFVESPQVHGLALLSGLGVLVVVRVICNVTEDREYSADELVQTQQRFWNLIANTSDIIMVFQPDGIIEYVSPAFERVLGYDPTHKTRFGIELIHSDEHERLVEFFFVIIDCPGETQWIDIRIRDVNDEWHWFEIALTNLLDDPSVGAIVANLHDISERRQYEEQLSLQAYHDPLTFLPNRQAFTDSLGEALARSYETRRPVAVLFLDLDRFKLVNDSLGHNAGDRLLTEVAERVRQAVRPGDIVARLGGDEFTVLLEDIDGADDAVLVAERILDAMRDPMDLGNRSLTVSTSIGIALTDGDLDAGEILREADLAMYSAKDKGRSRWALFDIEHARQVSNRLDLETELRRAIENWELEVYYQPEVSLSTGALVAFEALVRWNHPHRGLVMPNDFVPLAEETGLIVELDKFVLHEACRQIRSWQEIFGMREAIVVGVNLSPRFVRQARMVDEVTAIFRETGISPRCIQFEITERAALIDDERTLETLASLRALGATVAIDDFGTGYSSLAYLRQFPIDVLKVDQCFVSSMDTAVSERAIVEAVIMLGHALGLRVTAEGVERAEQATALQSLGCDSAQGWLWARALTAVAATRYLREEHGFGQAGRDVVAMRHHA